MGSLPVPKSIRGIFAGRGPETSLGVVLLEEAPADRHPLPFCDDRDSVLPFVTCFVGERENSSWCFHQGKAEGPWEARWREERQCLLARDQENARVHCFCELLDLVHVCSELSSFRVPPANDIDVGPVRRLVSQDLMRLFDQRLDRRILLNACLRAGGVVWKSNFQVLVERRSSKVAVSQLPECFVGSRRIHVCALQSWDWIRGHCHRWMWHHPVVCVAPNWSCPHSIGWGKAKERSRHDGCRWGRGGGLR